MDVRLRRRYYDEKETFGTSERVAEMSVRVERLKKPLAPNQG